jgi:DNA-binding CsgD family transcriptional regulator
VWLLAVEPEEAHTRLVDALKEASLTPKERKVFALLLRQHPNAKIAEELYVSPETVKTHVRNILKKLGLKSRKELFS